MNEVEVYGVDHSPWVQAVLLGLHEAKVPHRVRSLPPRETFKGGCDDAGGPDGRGFMAA